MIINYIKVAFRQLIANKTFSVVNIAGLAIGITASVLIMMVVLHEFSYDRFHAAGERIFRAEKQFTRDGRRSLYANPEFGPTLMATDSRIENYVRIFDASREIVKSDDNHVFFEEKFFFADSSFFGMFSFPLVKGDRKSLVRPGTAIVTETIARKYFGSTDVIGKVLTFDKKYQLEITGLGKDAPVNSTIQFGIVASFNTLLQMPETRDAVINNSSGFPTYVLLKSKADLAEVSQSILKTQYTNSAITYSLAPLYENHFNSNFGSTTTTKYAYTFLSVALLILLLALINYMNLTTARSMSRAKEVGVRKAIGASGRSLSLQFYFESAIITMTGFLLALVLIEGCRPFLVDLLGLEFDTDFLRSPYLYGAIALLLVGSILIAGSYPAIILPRFRAADVLKGQLTVSGRGAWFRKSLMVFQFSVSLCLAICTVVMNNQISHLSSFNTGLDREQVLVIPVKTLQPAQRRALKTDLQRKAGVEAVSLASLPLYKGQMSGISLTTSPVNNEKVGLKWMITDADFADVLNITFERKPIRTSGAYHLLNQSAATDFGLTDDSKDYSLTMGGDHVPAISGKISGVVHDFNYDAPRNPIQPLLLTVVSDSSAFMGENPTMYVRLAKGSIPSNLIANTQASYNIYSDGSPFTYFFLEDAFNEQQLSEARLNAMFSVFASIALVIACLGLFGLITFTSERRRKELSIRKLLGASMANILMLISMDLVVLLSISTAIAIPVAIYLSKEWLSGYFYQATISFQDVLLPTIITFAISLLVICARGMRTAFDNPAANLKNE